MRFISLIVAICFSFNVLAASGTVQEFEKLLDNYQYELTVEWDQKDQEFYNSKTKIFFEELEKLIKAGLTTEEITDLVSAKAKNSQVVEAIKLKMNLLGGLNFEELVQIIKSSSKDLYLEGASWNGSVIFPVIAGLLVAGVIGYFIWWDANHYCAAYESEYICRTYGNCRHNYTHYDPYYSGYYGDSICYGTSYTTCGYEDVCVDWQKK